MSVRKANKRAALEIFGGKKRIFLRRETAEPFWNGKRKAFFCMGIAALYLLLLLLAGIFEDAGRYSVNYSEQFAPPSVKHIFGTDSLGRDMFFRSVKGMSNSILVGILASAASSVIALALGVTAALKGGVWDGCINWCVDLCMSIPHLILLILISFLAGRGGKGVLVAVALTHWPELTRLVRAEALQISSSQYVQASYRMGKGKLSAAKEHILPHVFPVYLVGVILLFPHAVMHEAAVTFLGFGFPAETPAIGVILSESMDHIATGKWWLALFPGLMLLLAVALLETAGDQMRRLYHPATGNE